MRIAAVSPMINPLAQPYGGGTEAVTARLAEDLAARGHQVTIFATNGSAVRGARVENLDLDPNALRWPAAPEHMDGAMMRAFLAEEQRAFHRIALFLSARAADFDLVHNNSFSGVPFLLSGGLPMPMVTTLHVPPILVEQVTALRTLAEAGRPARLVAVSEGLAREFMAITPIDRVIHNGVEIPPAPENDAGAGLLFAGRISPEKGVDLAIDIALRAGRSLHIAGRIEDDAFYRREVAPRVDGRRIVYLGHLTQEAVWAEMAQAAAMLFTPRWPEPCSLAVLEGLARCTPAIAFATGGLVEQIQDGVTGFLVPNGDAAAAADAVARLPELRRDACRQDMIERFSIETMIGNYESYFQSIVNAHA